MQRKTVFLSICLILALFLAFPFSLRADESTINGFVTNNATHLLVYARVTNCFTKDMDAAILAGVPTTFTFLMELYQERPFWLDKKLARLTVGNTIKYDNVKRLFYVYSDSDKEPTSFQDFEGAQRAMADLNGFPVASMNSLKRNEYYYVRIKAKLDKVRLPLHMEYVFSFVSLWDFETDWYREGFFY
ncbi:MAG: DUF4390 domain-containing protein [Proteobacteria bacterium]|nr:DUF4390 domain-containing protein [Pseudomonadota bacterium]